MRPPPRAPWALPIIAAIAGAIAWIAPFDLVFTAVSGDNPARRALLIVVLAVIGGWAARGAGLRLEGHGARSPLLVGLVAAVLVAGWIVLLDCFAYRHTLAPGYVGYLRTPLGQRLFYFMLRAFNENVLYRLFAFGCVAWGLTRLYRPRKLPVTVLATAMVAVQCVNIGVNVVWYDGETLTLPTLAYDALRYVVPGVVWAALFVRNGFATAEVASVTCHLFLQPAFTVLLDR